MPIHLPSIIRPWERGELRRKRLGKEIGLGPRMELTMRHMHMCTSRGKKNHCMESMQMKRYIQWVGEANTIEEVMGFGTWRK